MRRSCFFLFLIFSWYLAGMYRSLPLMAFCLMELFLVGILVLQAFLSAKTWKVCFSDKKKTGFMGESVTCALNLTNRKRRSISRIDLRFRMSYPMQRKDVIQTLSASCTDGNGQAEFMLQIHCSGVLTVRLESVKIYDFLSLFSFRKRLDEEMQIAVFPQEQMLHFEQMPGTQKDKNFGQEQIYNQAGTAFGEVRQIREYQPGDSRRHIHWNLSARTENLWIREYKREADKDILIILDRSGIENADPVRLGAYYDLLSALVLGVQKHIKTVRIRWSYYRDGREWNMAVQDASQCRDMLYRLYQADKEAIEDTRKENVTEAEIPKQTFCLNQRLELFWNQELLHRFSPQKLEQEIKETIFFA